MNTTITTPRTLKYFSMFSGIGGFEVGISNALSKPKARAQDYENSRNTECRQELDTVPVCIGNSEIDKYADAIYKYHHGGTNYGDAAAIDVRRLPDFDLLCGGFPCQPFSVAGKGDGVDDPRGTLFQEILRVAGTKQPQYLLLENVKGLLSLKHDRTIKTIIAKIAELGYAVEWQVLNSKHFGVPQNRERVFIVGHLGGFSGRQIFPIIRYNSQVIKQIIAGSQDERVYSQDGLSPTLNTMQGGNKQPKVFAGTKIRRLTPIECERLQGFPDNYTKYGLFEGEVKEISDTQRYKCLGNAVTTNVIEYLAMSLFDGCGE